MVGIFPVTSVIPKRQNDDNNGGRGEAFLPWQPCELHHDVSNHGLSLFFRTCNNVLNLIMVTTLDISRVLFNLDPWGPPRRVPGTVTSCTVEPLRSRRTRDLLWRRAYASVARINPPHHSLEKCTWRSFTLTWHKLKPSERKKPLFFFFKKMPP